MAMADALSGQLKQFVKTDSYETATGHFRAGKEIVTRTTNRTRYWVTDEGYLRPEKIDTHTVQVN
jgi:hypothetical protein